MALFAVLGLASVLIMVGLTQVPAIFGVTGPEQITLIDILLVLSVKVLWGFLMNPFHGFFAGLLRFDIDANLSSLNAVVKALLVFWFISDLNIWGAVVATLAADILTNLLKVFYAKRLFPSLSFKISLIKLDEIKSLFAYSKHLVLNGIINTIGARSAPIIITKLFDLPSLAIQQISSNLVMHGQAFIGTITGVFSPIYNQMAAKKQNMEKIFVQTTTINIFVSTILNISLLMFGKVFIVLWVGDEFAYSYNILCFAVFATICSGFNTSANSILLAQANHKLLSAISFCIVAFNVPMSIYLGLEYGLIGIAMSGALTNLIFNIYVKMALFRHYNHYKTKAIYIRLFASIFLVYSLGLLGNYALEYLVIDSWLTLILSGAITFPFIILVCWVLLLDKPLKVMIFNLLASKLKLNKKSA